MELSFAPFIEADIPEMTRIMTRAFDDDTKKHLGKERGGPDGYDNGGFFRKWLFGHKETDGWKVMADGKAVGGIIVWIFPNGKTSSGRFSSIRTARTAASGARPGNSSRKNILKPGVGACRRRNKPSRTTSSTKRNAASAA